MVGPAAQRTAVAYACEAHGISQRGACSIVGADRCSVRYRALRSDDPALRQRIRELAEARRRFGYRRLQVLLGREGLHVNHKRFRRIYREEKRRGTRRPMALPEAPNQRWSLDFASDAFTDGRCFRILAVVDDFTRECLALVPDTSLPGVRVARELNAIIARRGKPKACVSDNGSELTSTAILKWSQEWSVDWHTIAPGPFDWLRVRAAAERIRREFHRSLAGRVSQRDALYFAGRGQSRTRGLAKRPQPVTAAFEPGQPDTDRVCQAMGQIA